LTALAFAAGSLGFLALREAVGGLAARSPAAGRAVSVLVGAVVRVGREGRDPGALERRRLLAAGAVAAFLGGFVALGPLPGLAAGAAGPWGVSRLLRARRERYRRAVDEGAAGAAIALADALGGGHSLRGALAEAAEAVPGAVGYELRRTRAELGAGARTESALEALRSRARSARLDSLVAACLLQRRAGGDLARLLRGLARSFEDQSRLDDEVKAATAQARFTGLVVVLLPLAGAGLAELASPGFLAGLAESALTAWLVGMALVLQVVGGVLIRRLGRVRV
jgi:tight adherence protein B